MLCNGRQHCNFNLVGEWSLKNETSKCFEWKWKLFLLEDETVILQIYGGIFLPFSPLFYSRDSGEVTNLLLSRTVKGL